MSSTELPNWCRPGQSVTIHSLKKKPALNGRRGEIVAGGASGGVQKAGRVMVRLENDADIKSFHHSNLWVTHYLAGVRVADLLHSQECALFQEYADAVGNAGMQTISLHRHAGVLAEVKAAVAKALGVPPDTVKIDIAGSLQKGTQTRSSDTDLVVRLDDRPVTKEDKLAIVTVLSELTPGSVRQLRHHFGPSLRVVWALYHPTHAVHCALLGYHAYWMLIGACDPML